MEHIAARGLTKDYGAGRGVFDLNFQVKKGEAFGFLGPNGAGKTTTIRQLMGFIRPDSGTCTLLGKPCFTQVSAIHRQVGYIPGELSLMDDMSAGAFFRFMARLRGMDDTGRAEELCSRFQLDPSAKIRRMSKGTKQKVGIVSAFLHDPALYILDEPTSGLDPLMQNRFIELLEEEHNRGKTVLLSSHLFEEVERTCSRVAIIRNGRLAAVDTAEALKATRAKTYRLTFLSEKDAQGFLMDFSSHSAEEAQQDNTSVILHIRRDLNTMLQAVGGRTLQSLDMKEQTLEEVFLHYYGGEKDA